MPPNGQQRGPNMDISSYFAPHGRLRRTHYFAAGFILNVLMSVAQVTENLLIILLSLALLWPLAMIGIQRAHDIGHGMTAPVIGLALAFIGGALREFESTNALGALMLIPALIISLWLLFSKPDPGPNQYGPNPREPELAYNE